MPAVAWLSRQSTVSSEPERAIIPVSPAGATIPALAESVTKVP